MKQSIKRKLKVYLPIFASIVLIAVIILVFLLQNRIKAKDYFNALINSNYTKQTQITTIKENNLLIYEKTEIVVFEGDNVYQQIHERKLSQDYNTDYDKTTIEVYYSQDTKYYFENGVWKTESFRIKENLNKYVLKIDYFEDIKFQKRFDEKGVLNGKIKDVYVKNIVSMGSLNNMSISITINKQLQISAFEIDAKTTTNRDVKISNSYSYGNEKVNMPC